MSIQAVFFDLDGTLYDRDALVLALVNEQFDAFQHELNASKDTFVTRVIELDDHGYRDKREVYRIVGAEYGLTSALCHRLHDDFWARYEAHSVLDDDVRHTLETLRQRGLKLAVITNGSTEWQQRKLDALGIASWFDAVLISETEGVRKPSPEIFHRALVRCNVDASETLFVGDHPDADIGGPLGAGLRAVWKTVPYWPCAHDVVSIRQLSEILSMCPSGATDERLLNEQVAYYRARAGEYDQWFLREGRYDRGPDHRAEWFGEVETVRQALTAAIKESDVLELACGTGLWTGQLARENRNALAVDASPEAIAINQVRVGADHVRYATADIFSWAPPRQFDAVFFAFWLSHVPESRFEQFWATVRAALKPGGQVFFVDSLLEQTSTAKDHRAIDGSGVVRRKLNDGREFDIVKVFYEPERLERRLAALGWRGWVRSSGKFFLYGVVER